MARSGRLDPLTRFSWRVYVLAPSGGEFIRGGFESCSSPAIRVNFQSYPEGGRHLNPVRLHESAVYKPVTLTRGVIDKTGVDDFAEWMKALFALISPEEAGATAPNYRNDIIIEHLNREAEPVKRYVLRNCIPVNYEPASDFNALDDGGFSIESLTFEYEGFEELRLDDPADSIIRRLRGAF